ncbi:hypothetical protein QUA56_12085 [Microcoleus sp. N3A4]|uniref:hypothetical protein n=1 Tax=Microcoleus sp. N3A4 TaxID=3055379 RepID=UPI002FD26705
MVIISECELDDRTNQKTAIAFSTRDLSKVWVRSFPFMLTGHRTLQITSRFTLINNSDQEFQRWYPPRDRTVESIQNRKSKILKKEHLSRASQSKI